MKKKLFLFIAFVALFFAGTAQNTGIGINPTGNLPDPSAALDIDADDGGLLIPRLTTTQRNAIQNPAISLQIYNTTTNCLQIFMPTTGWRDISCDCNNSPSTLVSFNFVDTATTNTNVSFTSPTSNVSFAWTFSQGSPANSNQQNPTVTWSAPGTYTVTLTATDNLGCSTTITGSIVIIACPPPMTFNFTNCGQTGNTGPSQNQCNSTYSNTPLNNLVTVAGGIQQVTIPFSGNYQIEAAGAKGGQTSYFGRGAIIRGTVPLNQGDVIKILVGQQGDGNANEGGGGGGTFVTTSNNVPLIIAGGGGGATYNQSGSPSGTTDGATSPNGRSGMSGGVGGTNGNGGSSLGTSCCYGSGGGGLNTNGQNGYRTGGQSFVNGGAGGMGGSSSNIPGGFGGGGGDGWYGGAGGGGYSGGGGSGGDSYGGGGGGSFVAINATNVATSDGQYNGSGSFNGNPIQNLGNYNSAHGYVNITLICP